MQKPRFHFKNGSALVLIIFAMLLTRGALFAESKTNEVIFAFQGLEMPKDSKAHIEAEAKVRGMGTNIVPLLLNELPHIGTMLATKETVQIQEAMRRRTILQNAFKILGTNLEPFALEFIRELKEDKNPSDAAYGLAQMSDQYAVFICEALTNKSSNVRLAAAGAITYLRTNSPLITASVPSLIVLLADESPYVRQFSANTLGKIGVEPAKCIPALLIRVKTDPDPLTQILAAGSIGRFGTNAVLFADNLRQIEKAENNPKVKHAIITAIKAISP